MSTGSPPAPLTSPDAPSSVWTRRVLPLALLALLLAVSAAGAWWVTGTYVSPAALAADSSPTQDKTFVLRRLTDPLHLYGRDPLWLLVLIPLLVAAFAYVVTLYIRDSRTVGWCWAAFLGSVRCLVYLMLAGAFLLPATQTWDRIESRSRVAVLFDVSGSMLHVKDDLVTPGVPAEQMPTRQQKVLAMLADDRVGFLRRLLERNPLDVWRFGGVLDRDPQLVTAEAPWDAGRWAAFLTPDPQAKLPDALDRDERARFDALEEKERAKFVSDRLGLYDQLVGGSNLGGSLEELLAGESSKSPLRQLQGVIVVSDGRSNQGSAQSFEEVIEETRKARVPVFVVAVGQDRDPSRITITVLQAPGQIRGDDRFPVKIEVEGEGLAGREVPLFLDVTRGARAGRPARPEAGAKPVATPGKKPGPDTGPDPAADELTLVEVDGKGAPTGVRVNLGKKVTLRPATPLRFSSGKPPQAQAEIPVDPAVLAAAAGKSLPNPQLRYELAGGDWRFQARVPRDPKEIFDAKEHLSDPATVTVAKRPLRVLLFAGGPTREYLFVRAMFVRGASDPADAAARGPGEAGTYEVSVLIQNARPDIVQDVPTDRLLKRFPYLLRDVGDPSVKPEDKFYNLGEYDLIIAFDPDWSRLSAEEATRLEQWVDKHGGGLIFVGGAINTVEMTRRDNRARIKPVLDLCPVILGDVRDLNRTTDKPWRLHFPGATPDLDFLVLDEAQKSARAGWDDFFQAREGTDPPAEETKHGFFSYYPVEGRKPSAAVIATFSDPAARLPDQEEQPYFVSMRYGSGRTFWIGSGELWRLRNYREAFHERFWTKLARYCGSTADLKRTRRGFLNLSRSFFANKPIEVEAKLYGRDLESALPETAKPELRLAPPAGAPPDAVPAKIEMRPKVKGVNDGWFAARFELKTPGEYGVTVVIPDTGDLLQGKFGVKESLPEELENVRPDFNQLYRLAGRVTDVGDRLKDKPEVREQLRRLPQPDAHRPEDAPRLYFDLRSAGLIPECLQTVREVKPSRGGYEDVWDRGADTTVDVWPFTPARIEWSVFMLVVVALLSTEWLSRKLLRLA